MLALLLIPVLVSGYIIVNARYINYFSIHRYEGQYLYLKVMYTGSACCLMALAVGLTLKMLAPGFHPALDIYAYFANAISHDSRYLGFSYYRFYIWIALISMTATGIALVITTISFCQQLISGQKIIRRLTIHKKQFRSKKLSILEPAKIYAQTKSTQINSIEHYLINMMILQRPVIITLKEGMVLIGMIASISEPNEAKHVSSDITIYPIMSGLHKADSSIMLIDNIFTLTPSISHKLTSPVLMMNAASIVQVASFNTDMIRLAPAPSAPLLAAC